MKVRSLVLIAALAVAATTSLARAGEATFSSDEQVNNAFDTFHIYNRYPTPAAVGGIAAMPPASALTPIPVNVLHCRRDYALGEASVGSEVEDAKGRARYDHRPRHRTAWTRHAYN